MNYPRPGNPTLLEKGPETLRAIVAGDGKAVDDALEGLGAGELMELHDVALFLADVCRMASRGRGW